MVMMIMSVMMMITMMMMMIAVSMIMVMMTSFSNQDKHTIINIYRENLERQ